jgi:hypothetical protein
MLAVLVVFSLLMVMEHAFSLWCGFGILAYLECATSCSWMMVLAPQGVRGWI